MPEIKVTRNIAVTNPEGLHLRAATLIAELARRYDSSVLLIKDHQRVKGTDVLQVISLVAKQGDQLVLEATGHDAEEALDALTRLFSDNLGEN